MAAPVVTVIIIPKTIEIATQIRAAFAKFALLILVPLPNAQTKSMIRFTSGMANMSNVITQSPVEIVPVFLVVIINLFDLPTLMAFRYMPRF